MTTYFKLVIALAILVVAGTGFWLRGKYTEIKTDVYAKREADIVKYINDRVLSFGLAPAFVEKNAARQQQKLKDFFDKYEFISLKNRIFKSSIKPVVKPEITDKKQQLGLF